MKKDWHLLHVIATDEKRRSNRFTDHGMNYAGFADTQFIGIDTEEDNRNNELRNFWVYALLRSVVYYLLLVPFRYGVLPIIRLIDRNKLQTVLTIPLIILFALYSPLTLSLATLPLVVTALGSIGFLLTTMLKFIQDQMTESNDSALTRFLSFLTQRSWQSLALFMCIAAAGMVGILFPAIMPLSTHALATIVIVLPLVMSIFSNLIMTIQTILSLSLFRKRMKRSSAY